MRSEVIELSTQEIIRALRCAASPYPGATTCTGCPYSDQQVTDEGLAVWCDVDRILLDAADRLSRLK